MGVILNWASTYPAGGIDDTVTNFPTVVDGTHDVLASHVNSLAAAVIELETAVGINGGLTVEELDGLPSVVPVQTLVFPNGSLTDLGSNTVQVTIASGSTDAASVTYDNSTSGLTASDVQAAIDEIDAAQDLAGRTARFIVGNAPAGDTLAECDYLDTGDGAAIEIAVAAANGAGQGDIFIRSGTYDLGSGAVVGPFTITSNQISIRGAGTETVIRGRDDQREVFTFSGQTDCTLEYMQISMPVAAVASTGDFIVDCGGRGFLTNLLIRFDTPFTNSDEPITAVVRDTGTGRHRNVIALVTPSAGSTQVACFELTGSYSLLSQCYGTIGDVILRVSGTGHRVTDFYGLAFDKCAEVSGVRHHLGVIFQNFGATGPVVSITGSQHRLGGSIEDFGGTADPIVELSAGSSRCIISNLLFDAPVGDAIEVITGASNNLLLGLQLDGGTVTAPIGTLTEQGHNVP